MTIKNESDAINKKYSQLERLVIEFPDKPWNFENLSCNPAITFEFVKNNPSFSWDYYSFSGNNPNITWGIVKQNPNFCWGFSSLIRNPCITWDIVQNNWDLFPTKYRFSKNPNVTKEIILDNPGIPWRMDWVATTISLDFDSAKNFTLEGLYTSLGTLTRDYYDMLSMNDGIFFEDIKKNPDKPWNSDFVSLNPNITWDIVRDNPDFRWNYEYLSCNHNLITWDLVESNPDKPWNYLYLSMNRNISWDVIKANPDKPWNFLFLPRNPNITMYIIKSNPDKFSSYKHLSYNPNLTYEFVKNNIDKDWDYNLLSKNDFGCSGYRLKEKQEIFAKIIQRACYNWIFKSETNDGKLGIKIRLGMKELYGLNEAPLFLKEIKQ